MIVRLLEEAAKSSSVSEKPALKDLESHFGLDTKLEGLISLLASRSHDWKNWTIERIREVPIEDSGAEPIENLRLTLVSSDDHRLEKIHQGDFSPSQIIFELLPLMPREASKANLNDTDWKTKAHRLVNSAGDLHDAKSLIRREIRSFMKTPRIDFFVKIQ